ncbi:hypothetical protein GJ672_03045 [Spiribacter sp. 2438]|uniref:hypothetical protein n=1 Tax=Spiribacter sp. 2438 TaxID=2666185 RepID=UPI0012AF001D|nr:hypothetical protein [Spiribacter sp. 2438]QGM21339.1 hypothetical protein GJ672_03045 [Spiribacter sp. 2438]
MPTKSSKSATSSPLDSVKLELAVVLGLAVGLLVVMFRVDLGHWTEIGLLVLAGFAFGGWLAWRTRRAVDQHQAGGDH